ncbi:MAG: mannose-1-phosphate guanylyltransferase/mannose-6-phosphate isomerase [Methylacidiphilales bacterium]|nr:mannose-1-phosphate guanylyltransferase/mannose-6-phosphate isomerase [Candidatus Methylacidiphilales bacterium]
MLGVILAGGSGTRLWPLSRDEFPKQFLTLVGNYSLFQDAVLRAKTICDTIIIVGAVEHKFIILDQLKQIKQSDTCKLLLESNKKNTAPAIVTLAKILLGGAFAEVPMLILSADHSIETSDRFNSAVIKAGELAKENKVVCFGIVPTHAHTGYGYLEVDAHSVISFREKPDKATAESFLAQGSYLWNAGIFCFSAKTLIAEATQHCPDLLNEISKLSLPVTLEAITILEKYPSTMQTISVDYAIMERTKNLAYVSLQNAWSDIGSWDALTAQLPHSQDNCAIVGEVISTDCQQSLLYATSKPIVAVGLQHIAVVDTPDVLLVASLEKSQQLKAIVETVREKYPNLTREANTTHRPWGTYTIIQVGEGYKIKKIMVLPNQALSLQSHVHRSEHWVVITGEATVTNGEEILVLRVNQSTFIPAGNKHRLENKTSQPLILIEIQTGSYLGEDDIKRFDDNYNR